MSKPRYDWWGYVKGMIRRYPQLCDEREALKCTSVIADYSGQPHGTGLSDSTGMAAGATLTGVKEREWQAVKDAIRKTAKSYAGKDKVRLIELVFWKKSHTLEGAAEEIHVSLRTALRWHGDFIREVAKFFGLLD